MSEIIQIWKSNHYAQLILDIFLPIMFYITFKKRKKFVQLKFFPLYLGSFNLLMLNEYTYYLVKHTQYSHFLGDIYRFGNYFVSLIEFITFSYFFFYTTQSFRIRKIIKLLAIITFLIFLIFCIPISFLNFDSLHLLNHLYLLELIVLLTMTIFYFIDLFWLKPVLNLKESPDFWISAGLMFYLLGTLPVTIITNNLYVNDRSLYKSVFSIINLLYTLLFLMVLKAYMCKSKSDYQYNN